MKNGAHWYSLIDQIMLPCGGIKHSRADYTIWNHPIFWAANKDKASVYDGVDINRILAAAQLKPCTKSVLVNAPRTRVPNTH